MKIIHADTQIVRFATRTLLQSVIEQADFFKAGSYPELLCELQRRHHDLIILEANLPGGESFNMVQVMKNMQPEAAILIFSEIEEDPYGLHFLKAGASGFVSKTSEIEEFVDAVRTVLTLGKYFSPAVKLAALDQLGNLPHLHRSPLQSLSPKELLVMDMLLKGNWSKEIARKLHLTHSSVSTYKARIFKKLNVSTLIEMYQVIQEHKDKSHRDRLRS